jgi:hypothetical protein
MRLSIPLALLLAVITTSPSDAESEGQAPAHSATIRGDVPAMWKQGEAVCFGVFGL